MSLELRNVVKQVGAETHIYPTSLVFERGVFNILLGSTLAGKTSLLHLMSGLEKPGKGEIWFDGKNVTGVAVQKRNVSMVYQQFINYPNYTIFDNIASPLYVAGFDAGEIKKRVGSLAEMLKLTPMLDRKPSELSGGQQQRTAIARALAKDADLVLLDEPLANLDYKLREELRDDLPKLFADRGCVVVYATTEPGEALLLGGRTAALDKGSVVQFGETGKVYRSPDSLLSAQVFSDPPINVISISRKGDVFETAGGLSWPAGDSKLGDGEYIFGLRPHHVTPVKSGVEQLEIKGKVQVKEISGSESLIHFAFAGNVWISQVRGIFDLKLGSEVAFYADISKGMFFNPDGSCVD